MNRKSSVIVIFLLCLVGFTTQVFGIGANPDPLKIQQPDGTSITVANHGDEWVHWLATVDGYRIVKNKAGVFEYATMLKSGQIMPSGVKAADVSRRHFAESQYVKDLPKHLGVSSQQNASKRMAASSMLKSTTATNGYPTSGTQKMLVIMANFSDTDTAYSRNQFDNLMNQVGYKGTGSFRDFHLENSNYSLTINSTVTKWVKLSNTHDYYGPENKWGQFVYDAIVKANAAGVDFSQYDNDGDGVVEGVTVIHQGKGQEGSSNPLDIWSHSYTLSTFGYTPSQRTFDGVKVNVYAVMPELYGSGTEMTSIGVVCHEFGHVLGAPDYYDTDTDLDGSQLGTGRWDLMANGAYNSAGNMPAHHNPLSKLQFGWITAQTLTQPQQVAVQPIRVGLKAYRVNTQTPREFFLIENRQKTGFDAALPGSGLMIYHVDSNYIEQHSYDNSVNASNHQGMYPKAAGGIVDSPNCPFPGSTGSYTSFTDITTPSSLSWSQQLTNRSITGIKVDGQNIVFDFMALQNGAPRSFTSGVVDHSSIQLNWEPSTENYPVLLAYSTTNTFGIPVNGQAYAPGNVIPEGGTVLVSGSAVKAFLHNSLNELTTYHYRLWSNTGAKYATPLAASAMTISGPVSSYPWVDDFEEGLIRWTQSKVVGLGDWTIAAGGKSAAVGAANHPASAFSGIQNAHFYNEKISATKLISPKFVASAAQKFRVVFYHAQELWNSDQDSLKVYYRLYGAPTWVLLATYNENTPLWRERNIDFTPGGNFEIAFEGYANYGYGVVLDKVSVFPYNSTPPLSSSINLVVSEQMQTSMKVSWTKGSGTKYLLVGRRGSEVLGLPDDGVKYVANANWGLGNYLMADEFVLNAGKSTSLTISGLQAFSDYHFAVFDYDSLTHHYRILPLTGIGKTLAGIVKVGITVLDKNSLPIQGATATIAGQIATTNSLGFVEFLMDMSGSMMPFSVSKTGFDVAFGKVTPIVDKSLNVTLRSLSQIPVKINSLAADYNDVDLTWNPVINENFAGYQPFALTIPNWTFYDGDMGQTWGLFGTIGYPNEGYTGSFIVMNSYNGDGINLPCEPYVNNQFLGCAVSKVKPNNDWIISPVISIQSATWLSFMAKSYTSNFGLERIKVLVSETGSTNPANFATISSGPYLDVPTTWTQYKYDLSSYTGKNIRFAIQCVSNDAYLLMLDLIEVSANEPVAKSIAFKSSSVDSNDFNSNIVNTLKTDFAPQYSPTVATASVVDNVKYQVYRNGTLVSTLDGMTNNSFKDVDLPCGDYSYSVSVVHQSPVSVVNSSAQAVSTCNQVDVIVSDAIGFVAAASVTFNNVTLLTNALGKVTFYNVPNGAGYTLKVSKAGYVDVNQSVSVSGNSVIQVTSVFTHIDGVNALKPVVTPNPTNGEVNIQVNVAGVEYQYQLFSVIGNLVLSGYSIADNQKIDLSSLPQGIYLLKVGINDDVHVTKIKKR